MDEATGTRFDRVRLVLNAILGSANHSTAVTQLETVRVKEGWSLQKLSQALLDERKERLAGPK